MWCQPKAETDPLIAVHGAADGVLAVALLAQVGLHVREHPLIAACEPDLAAAAVRLLCARLVYCL